MNIGKDARPHLGIYGKRNTGKSSLINALTNQEISIVSDIAGTTTDPVKKTIEINGIGPVVLIDTAGTDDDSELGTKRIEKTLQSIKQIDFALLVLTHNNISSTEHTLINRFVEFEIPYLLVHNKSDIEPLNNSFILELQKYKLEKPVEVSALKGKGISELIALIKKSMPQSAYLSKTLVGSLLNYGDTVLLITPIDNEAPEGRLILPQIQVIRDILDNDCVAIVAKEREIDKLLQNLNPRPALAITDSQIFLKADASIPKDIPLTSFSIILAHHKGDFANYLKGTPKINELKNGDRILILESCTHHVSCDDIGRVKIPRWLSNFTGKKLEFDTVAGLNNLPRNIQEYSLVIQCGGCMITRKQIINRLKPAIDAGIPVTNYGMAIAWVHGIYNRAVAPFIHKHEEVNYL